MLQQLMALYKDPTLDMRKSPDVSFTGKIAADVGGPTKEFFHTAIEALLKWILSTECSYSQAS